MTDPNSAGFLTGLGAVLYRAGRLDEGLKNLQQAEAATQKTDDDRVSEDCGFWRWPTAVSTIRQTPKSGSERPCRTAKTATQLHKAGTQELRWNQRLSLSLLRKEAEELVSKKGPNAAYRIQELARRREEVAANNLVPLRLRKMAYSGGTGLRTSSGERARSPVVVVRRGARLT